MFCRLFKLSEKTGLPIHEQEDCNSSCRRYVDQKTCTVCEKCMETLTKEKYSWFFETRICLDTPISSKSGNLKYVAAISLIHPAHNDIWIVQQLRHDKINDTWDTEYKFYFGNEAKEFINLKQINIFLKSNGYTGRRIKEDDFKMTKPEENN
jgi:hypothetical protein